jgi:hypothetical protein
MSSKYLGRKKVLLRKKKSVILIIALSILFVACYLAVGRFDGSHQDGCLNVSEKTSDMFGSASREDILNRYKSVSSCRVGKNDPSLEKISKEEKKQLILLHASLAIDYSNQGAKKSAELSATNAIHIYNSMSQDEKRQSDLSSYILDMQDIIEGDF